MRTKDPGTRRQLCLKIKGTSDRIDKKAFGLELVKRATGMFSRLRRMMGWTMWRGQPPPKWKKEQR
jgi:hypothetical protein